MSLTFTVPGEPASKARPRFDGRGRKGRTYTPEKTKAAEEAVALHFSLAGGRFEPDPEVTFAVKITFYNGTRQRRDVDNMIKLVLDGLNQVAWVDDAQVTDVMGRKRFTTKAEARTVVELEPIGRMDRLRKACERCGEQFITYESLKTQRFCTKTCGNAAREEARRKVCEQCGKEYLAHGATHQRRFCSKQCQHDHGHVVITCDVCGKDFDQFKSWAARRPCCSPECSRIRAERVRLERRAAKAATE